MKNTLLFDELGWGMLLVCQSGKSFEEDIDFSKYHKEKPLELVSNHRIAYILTESHADDMPVKVNIVQQEKNYASTDRHNSKGYLGTANMISDTKKIYIGDIEKTESCVLDLDTTQYAIESYAINNGEHIEITLVVFPTV